jgi:hypothetical protein
MLTQLFAQIGNLDLKALPAVKSTTLPILLTAGIHLWLLYLLDRTTFTQLWNTAKADTAASIITIVLASTVVSGITPFLTEFLQGRHLPSLKGKIGADARNFAYFSIPDTEASRYVRSTRFGDIYAALQDYTMTRYGIDLELIWTRLQRTIRSNSNSTAFITALDGAKSEVDFAVAMTFLSTALFFGWTVYLVLDPSRSYMDLVLVAGAAPVAAYAFYQLACRNYIVFTDLVRTAVDCHRFGVLDDLRLPLPENTTQELLLWDLLMRRIRSGEDISFTYEIKP